MVLGVGRGDHLVTTFRGADPAQTFFPVCLKLKGFRTECPTDRL